MLVAYFHSRAIQNLFTEYSQSSVPLPWKQFSVFCSIICSDNIAEIAIAGGIKKLGIPIWNNNNKDYNKYFVVASTQ